MIYFFYYLNLLFFIYYISIYLSSHIILLYFTSIMNFIQGQIYNDLNDPISRNHNNNSNNNNSCVEERNSLACPRNVTFWWIFRLIATRRGLTAIWTTFREWNGKMTSRWVMQNVIVATRSPIPLRENNRVLWNQETHEGSF